MAPSHKRKAVDDDFVHTISDNEADIAEEEVAQPAPPKKRAKTTKKNKKNKTNGDVEAESAVEEEQDSIWGQKDDDDGAMDSEFEFIPDNTNALEGDDFEGWGFDGAKKAMNGGENKGVDLDEIIRRRREKKEGAPNGTATEEITEDIIDHEDDADDLEMDDDEDGVLAEDAFGMGAGSDVDEDEDDDKKDSENEDDEGDEPASDDDSVATPVNHPEDDGSDASDEEDAEEAAKREAFFAPEEKEKSGKRTVLSSFQGMSLSRPILRGLASVGFIKPTPIQAKTIPIALMGKDVVGGAVTGSGKTAAFVVPILERLLYRPKKVPTTRVVILTPTRELAIQCHAVATKLASHTDIKFCLAVGGLSLKVQEAELRLRPDVIIATPGRFIDHMRNSPSFTIETVEIMILDEADRMLEDGFADELNEILTTLPKSRQTMLFSATMTSSVDRLIRAGLNKPVRIMVDSQKKTVGTLVQEFVRLRPGREEKRLGYLVYLCKNLYQERVIIFFRQKKIAHRTRIIFGLLGLSCAELHGSMNQAQRIASVENFRDGKVSFLLATDLASRGLDIKGVDTVINYEAPQSVDIYVHRVGRTARAGRSGTAVTLAAEPDRKVVKAAVKLGKSSGAKISSRIIEPTEADAWQEKIDEMEDEIEEIMQEEKEEKQIQQVEMQVKKGENMIRYEDEIKSRPRRTWFETQQDKKTAKDAGRAELNGVRDRMKKKGDGKLSNKDKKKLDAKAAMSEGRAWKKGRAERDGKGAIEAAKKAKKAKTKSKGGPGPKKAKRRAARILNREKLAPFKRFGFLRSLRSSPHPHHRSSLLRYLFPLSVRERYRERLLDFHLDTLPQYKRSLQSRIYRWLVNRERKRQEGTRLVDVVARQGRRLLLGPEPRGGTSRLLRAVGRRRGVKDASGKSVDGGKTKPETNMTSRYDYGYRNGGASAYGSDSGAESLREPGTRRRKLAALAGSVYRAGAAAASELKEQYNNTRVRGVEPFDAQQLTIPGSFPNVAVVTKGKEQMVLFPSYAKRHVKQFGKQRYSQPGEAHYASQTSLNDEDYWKQEWAKMEDEKAIVDVDVRGWVYNPHTGPMTRRNRVLIGLARRLSGIPPPTVNNNPSIHEEHERMREEQKIAKEAREIEKRGQREKEAANRGGYSEMPREDNSDEETDSIYLSRTRSGTGSPPSAPSSPVLAARIAAAQPGELTEAELAVANANMMARLGPFLTVPLVESPVTLFFYNDTQSQSRTVMTNDSGHFVTRVALDFVPTHVRVLAAESSLSVTEPVKLIESKGVSLISDIDDTIKRSSISLGAREIFRNTFIRDLGDLTVEGVKEWYNRLHDMGVSIHYCSNSPWQLFPVIATFFHLAGLPPGSIHLKQYSGMLQGIFEPVAERKKGTLERILRDFPERKFLLVGDSGEADLEVYTELAAANPGRILAVFIRDVTTPDHTKFFESSFGSGGPRMSRSQTARPQLDPGNPQSDEPVDRPALPPRLASAPSKPEENLIDLSEEPEEMAPSETQRLADIQDMANLKTSVSALDLLDRKPPPRPAKPPALRSTPSETGPGLLANKSARGDSPPLASPRSRKPSGSHPLAQMQTLSDQNVPTNSTLAKARDQPTASGSSSSNTPSSSNSTGSKQAPPLPPPRRKGTGASSLRNLSPRMGAQSRRSTANSDIDFDPLPGSHYQQQSPTGTTTPTGTGTSQVVNKKVDMWRRRLARAHEMLDQQGVRLYTWRKGDDVVAEAEGIVQQAMKELESGGRDR